MAAFLIQASAKPGLEVAALGYVLGRL